MTRSTRDAIISIGMGLVIGLLARTALRGQELEPLEAPATDSAWTAYRRPTDATELATRLRQLRRYCAAGRGLAFGTPALFRDPQGRLVAAFSHPTFAAPHKVVRDAEGNIVSESGGDRILLVRGKALIKAASQLCAPAFRDGRRGHSGSWIRSAAMCALCGGFRRG